MHEGTGKTSLYFAFSAKLLTSVVKFLLVNAAKLNSYQLFFLFVEWCTSMILIG